MTDNNEKVIPNVDSKSKEERNVPDLRFKEFTNEYKKINFGNSFKLYRGSSPRPIVEYISSNPNDPLWIKIGDMPENSVFVNEIKEHITIDGAKKSRAVYKGDMILSNSMSYGKPYILNVNGYIHDGWFVIRDYQRNYDRDYLMQLLSSPSVQKRYSQIAAGGVVLNISSDLVNSVCVKIPNIEEQKKISKFLSTIDTKINTQKKIIESKKSLIKSLYQHYFKNKERLYTVADVSTLIKGKQVNNKDLIINGDYDFINGGIEPSGKYNKYNAENCISISEGGNSCGFVNFIEGKFWSGGHNYTLNTKSSIRQNYLYHYLKYNENEIMNLRVGSGLPNIQKNALENYKLYIPSTDEQAQISCVLDTLLHDIKLEEKVLQLYQSQKDYLLNHMFI